MSFAEPPSVSVVSSHPLNSDILEHPTAEYRNSDEVLSPDSYSSQVLKIRCNQSVDQDFVFTWRLPGPTT